MKTSPERIAEIRAAWSQDRQDRRDFWRANRSMLVFDFIADLIGGTILGFLAGLSIFIWALQQIAPN